MKTLIVVPTYNESENIRNLIPSILQVRPDVEILVVDDNSPDGTAGIVREMQKNNPHLHLLLREKKQGLGRAYVAGFNWGLERGFETLVEMDADFSHRPVDLAKILTEMNGYDFIVGSRWVSGGATENWGLMRKFISKGGSLYARGILGYPIQDWTGGFNAYRAHTLRAIGLDRVQSEGYSFQIELKFRALKHGFKGLEVPILFADRKAGHSKMSSKIVLEALYRVWKIRMLTT